MAAFADLTPYTYFHAEGDLPGTVNVGWLAAGQPFPTGVTSAEFRDKLARLCQQRFKQTRGVHGCEFCTGRDRPRSSSEMRVSLGDRVYAAPSLVHHYVVAHDYRPPDEFVAAVLAWEADANLRPAGRATPQARRAADMCPLFPPTVGMPSPCERFELPAPKVSPHRGGTAD